jgi:hypothetical protein
MLFTLLMRCASMALAVKSKQQRQDKQHISRHHGKNGVVACLVWFILAGTLCTCTRRGSV